MGSSVILPTPGQPHTGADPGFKSGSVPSFTTFSFKNIGPPSQLYVQRDDVMLIRAATSLAGQSVRINFRLLIPFLPVAGQPKVSGADTEDVQPVSGGSVIRGSQVFAVPAGGNINNFTIALAEGYLLAVVCDFVPTGAQPGQCFVEVLLIQGPIATAINGQLLCSGYPVQSRHVGWPGGVVDQAEAGPGFIHSVQQANPAAGADWTYTVAANLRQRIQSLTAQLLTSAAVANRNVELIVDDGANTVWRTSAPASVVASTTQQVSATGTNNPTGVVTTDYSLVIPPGLVLLAGQRIRTVTTGIQAGDQWSNIFLLVEEWLSL